MARKVAFDRETALQAALLEFWRDGYDKTSLEQLLKGMGIQLSSFYNSFKSKENLFSEVLKYYRTSLGLERLRILTNEELTGKESLLGYFDHLVFRSSKKGYPPGCFMMKTAVNLTDPASPVGQEVATSIHNIEKGLTNALERGRRDGSFPKSMKTLETARILTAAAYGISVLSRTKKSKKELFATAQALVEALSC